MIKNKSNKNESTFKDTFLFLWGRRLAQTLSTDDERLELLDNDLESVLLLQEPSNTAEKQMTIKQVKYSNTKKN